MEWSIRKKVTNKRNLTSHLYGYDIKGEGWTVIDSEAKVIRMIFDMYINNKTYISIVEKLHKMKIKTSTGKDRWHTGTIEQMVKNEKYAGHMALGKTYLLNGNQLRTRRQNYNQEHFVYNHHEPIISQEIFDQAMNLRKSRSRNTINTYVPEVESLHLTHILFILKKIKNILNTLSKDRKANMKYQHYIVIISREKIE